MRGFLFFLSLLCLCSSAEAQVKTEAALIDALMKSLRTEDSKAYTQLFSGADSMITWVLKNGDKGSKTYQRMLYLQNNYAAKREFDSSIVQTTTKTFTEFLKQGTAIGVHWDHVLFMRYELQKIRTREGLPEEEITPFRYLGYVFFKDVLTRKSYGFTIYDVMQVNNLWYGAQLIQIFPAANKEEFQKELVAEKKRQRLKELGIVDTTEASKQYSYDDEEDEDRPSSMKEVLDRKYYKGKFDNEISVQLYVRYIKGNCPEVICSWEALFKFGDEDDYVRMDVSRTPDGKWIFIEDLGGMELTLDGDTYTGSYASSSDKTEYTVRFQEAPASLKKIKKLDEMLEFGIHGK
jgi:hypothetical protein